MAAQMAARHDDTVRDTAPVAFHELLLRWRTEANESPADLAAALGLSDARTYNTYERPPDHTSARTPPVDVARRLFAHYRDQGIAGPEDYDAFVAARKERRAQGRRSVARPAPRHDSPNDDTSKGIAPGASLPRQRTALVGRAALAGDLCALLRDPDVALVTLLGTGGAGKTRVAIAVGQRLRDARDAFPDGVLFVDLSAVVTAGDVAAAIADRLGAVAPASDTPLDRIAALLAGRAMLLVLDNFEHVVEAASVVSDLLARCEGLTALVTSRVPLNLHGEQRREVPPLPPPDAATLFVRRVRDATPGFRRMPANEGAIEDLCQRLDGLPLALELAARRYADFGSAENLLAALTPALPILAEGPRDAPARQRTMRATVAWSYALLTPDERWLFRWLAVCRGGCTPDAARALAAGRVPVDACLGALVAQHLTEAIPAEEAGGEPRVRMLEVIREYGLEQLEAAGEREAACRAHAGHVLALAEAAGPALLRADQAAWLARLDREHDNIRAALAWVLEAGDGETALRLGTALWKYHEVRGHVGEGRRGLDRAFALDGAVPARVRARALFALARLATLQLDYAAAEDAHRRGDASCRAIGDVWGLANVLNSWGGLIAQSRGEEIDRAIALHGESLDLYRQLDDAVGMADATYNLGLSHVLKWDSAGAVPWYEESYRLNVDVGDLRGQAYAQLGIGIASYMMRAFARAQVAFDTCLGIARRADDAELIAYALDGVAAIAGVRGEAERAGHLFGAATRLRRELRQMLPESYLGLRQIALDVARETAAAPEVFDTAHERGLAMTAAKAVALATADRPDALPDTINGQVAPKE